MSELLESGLSFGFNLAAAIVVVRGIYYPRRRNRDYVFTFFAFNTVTFFVINLLSTVDLTIGFGFGLFAIFSVLRYRTQTIPIREMTYMFVIIALPVLNSILIKDRNYAELAAANLATIGLLYVLEKEWGFHYETRKTITYERIEMIQPQNWSLLVADLEQRTGLAIKRVEIGRLNFLRDTAEINIYYDAPAATATPVSFVHNHDEDDEE